MGHYENDITSPLQFVSYHNCYSRQVMLNAFPLFLPVVYFFKETSGTREDMGYGRTIQFPQILRQLFGEFTL